MAKLSVIIPVYNSEKYIEKCITSFLSQTDNNFEIIFIDDCSQDSSKNIISKYLADHKNFKLIINEQNKGITFSRKVGIEKADGDYLSFVDSDDWVETDYVESILSEFEKNQDINTVMFKFFERYEKGTKLKFAFYPVYFNSKSSIVTINSHNIFDYPTFCWAKAYKTKFIKSENITFYGKIFEEFAFYVSLCIKSPKISIIDKRIYNYLYRDSSWTADDSKEKIKLKLDNLKDLKYFTENLIKVNSCNEDLKNVLLNRIETLENYYKKMQL